MAARRRLRGRSATPRRQAGQSLVEFSLIVFPLFLVLLGVVQFGLIFNTYVTMTNAARDAARLGTIYVYTTDDGMTKATNDQARNQSIEDAVLASMNMLGKTAPHFATTGTFSQSVSTPVITYTDGDLVIKYDTSGVTDSDPRTGQKVTVTANYHQDLVVPMISAFLPKDAGGRLQLTGEVTMVIN
jgi:Flp pilus assembly protein TadG